MQKGDASSFSVGDSSQQLPQRPARLKLNYSFQAKAPSSTREADSSFLSSRGG